jgi:hypothetical protein
MARTAIASLACAAVALGAATPAGAASVTRDCGNYGYNEDTEESGWTMGEVSGAGIFNVRATRTPCAAARRVALKAYPGQKQYRGWKCRYLKQDYEYAKVRCSQNARQYVTWETGA